MISADRAIEIARSHIEAHDPRADFEGRAAEVADEEARWHVSFPFTDPDMLGGEPHVLVAKATGAVDRFYNTK
jgi:hypothetical protein